MTSTWPSGWTPVGFRGTRASGTRSICRCTFTSSWAAQSMCACSTTPLAFRYHVLKGRPLVVRDETFLDELRARTWDDYLDFQPFARQYLREVLSE